MFCTLVQIERHVGRPTGVIMTRHGHKLAVAFSALLGAFAPASMANAYPVDCAILLCLAGGFPASAECSAAKAEMIRRITPWPVEPPLQLWRCPMRSSGNISMPGVGPDGLTADVRRYRDGIEIYHVRSFYHHRSGDNDYTVDSTEVGEYRGNGDFHWVRSSYEDGPSWLAEVAGGTTRTYTLHGADSDPRVIGRPGRPEQTVTKNDYQGRLRGVFLRYRDHTGAIQSEFVRY